MIDVDFGEEEQYQGLRRSGRTKERPSFVELVLRTKIVSTEEQAKYVLLGGAVGILILAFIIPSFLAGSQPRVPQSVIDAAMESSPGEVH